ncbi:MAG: DEAD/DEAH box helicase [Alphaproteobacteria bacterium]|nr:MAG: DEAD/DEAH box helicase [Alphaproteobacteria bacterium]
MSFNDLGLSAEVQRAVADLGYQSPTPIQQQAIPLVLAGHDVLGCAQTGTGKTAGFVLPMLDKLSQGRAKARMPRSLILEPTRELAAQVAGDFDNYGRHHRLTQALLIGGESMDAQIRRMETGVDVLIATPGRLMDLFDRGRILMTDIRMFVIDEADRMLDMGFIPDIEKIASRLPKSRQTLLFSATMPTEIRKLAQKFLTNPKEVSVAPPSSTVDAIAQSVVKVASRDKRDVLRDLLRGQQVDSAFIFCNRKRDVDVLFNSLKRHGFPVGALHGDMPQERRTEILASFKGGETRLLVCSDVAARGLDIDNVSHVFNFDVPINAEDYVHRIGRTGRAGRSGSAVTLVTSSEGERLQAIESLIRRPIPALAGFEAPAQGIEAEPSSETEKPRRTMRGGRGGGTRVGQARAPSTRGEHSAETPSPVSVHRSATVAREETPQPRPSLPLPNPPLPSARPVFEHTAMAPSSMATASQHSFAARPERQFHQTAVVRHSGPGFHGDRVPAFMQKPVPARVIPAGE